MTTCELRKKAAAVIQERGWCQDDYEDNGAVCTIGALNVAAGRTPDDEDLEQLSSVAESMGLFVLGGIAAWNDAPDRTQAEVIARLLDGCDDVSAE